MLEKAIDASELTQREIADRAGLKNANIISMLKSGDSTGPDMAACIDRFTGLLPGTREIRVATWGDGAPVADMCFRLIDGEWRAFTYKRQPRKRSYRKMETPDARRKLWLAAARQKGHMHVWEEYEAKQAAR